MWISLPGEEWLANTVIDRLCFGSTAAEQTQGGQAAFHFLPGQVLGVVWWRRRSAGRQHRAFAVVAHRA